MFWSVAVHAHSTGELKILAGAGPKKLRIHGEPGDRYVLEGASDLMARNWEVLQQLVLPQSFAEWIDPASVQLPQRFYRLISLALEPAAVTNFRLIDQQGKSRELQYYSNNRAVVLVYADVTCAELGEAIPTIKALRHQFEPRGIVFWLVAPNAHMTRSDLAARASALGIDWPVLLDAAQVVTRDLGAHHTLETVCIDALDRSILYHGAIDNRTPTTASTQNYLADALENVLAGKAVSPARTDLTGGCQLALTPQTAVSYAKDIAPLLRKHCVECHSAGNIAPWEMNSYEVVKNFAPLIKEKVMTGEMPPWHADPAYGSFSNDVSLKPEEAAILVQWVNAGAQRGDGPDPLAELFANQPPPTDYPHTWPLELGEPDFVITLPKFTVKASGEIPYEYVTIPVDLPSDKWLRAAAVLPGNTKVVHHSLVFVGSLFDSLGGLAGFFAGYVPGMKPVEFPSGTAKLLPANSQVTFQMHYTAIGKVETDETRLGLYFAKETPQAKLVTTAAATLDIQLRPGAAEYERQADVFLLPQTKDILVHEMSPHMHYRGSRFKFEAIYPNGTTEVLLSVPKYDFHWQTLYRLAQPKRLPAGSKIRCSGAFDNSAQNPDNPNPSATVRFGEQTDDEMFIGYVNFSEVP